MFFVCGVALAARHGFVRAFQFEVCESVIKRFGVKLNDIGFAALVVGVAGFAFRCCDAGALAVKAMFAGNVGRDVLVAFET